MEKRTDLFKLFEDYEGKKLYTGEGNFVKGKKECPNCKGIMIRKPIKQPFIDAGNSFLMVDASPSTGILKVNKTEPEYAWFCQGCSLAGASTQTKPIIPIEVNKL